MEALKGLLKKNRAWAKSQLDEDPECFSRLSEGQQPEYLWIGCCDSRVPAEIITGLCPGEILVHRNIANQVLPIDINARSILQFALTVLKIRKVIIAGHYSCGGVGAALAGNAQGDVAAWLCGIQETYRNNEAQFKHIMQHEKKVDALSELNVVQQVNNVARSDVARQVWDSGEKLAIYGLIYDIKTGELKDLDVCVQSSEGVETLSVKYSQGETK